MLTKQIKKLASQNIRFCKTAPNEYILFQSKHIPNGDISLNNKFETIRKFAEKYHGECVGTSAHYIQGNERRMTFYMVLDCVVANEFDNEIID